MRTARIVKCLGFTLEVLISKVDGLEDPLYRIRSIPQFVFVDNFLAGETHDLVILLEQEIEHREDILQTRTFVSEVRSGARACAKALTHLFDPPGTGDQDQGIHSINIIPDGLQTFAQPLLLFVYVVLELLQEPFRGMVWLEGRGQFRDTSPDGMEISVNRAAHGWVNVGLQGEHLSEEMVDLVAVYRCRYLPP